MATLSKSKYTLSCQCPKALWLRTHKPEEATQARQALLDYCHLDTLAMVRIWQELMKKVYSLNP